MIYTFLANQASDDPIYVQLYQYIRQMIIHQDILTGEKLPSIREASHHLKLSKTTIESAYFQLATEGYIESIPKKGYFVVALHDYIFKNAPEKPFTHTGPTIEKQTLHYINEDVHHGSVDWHAWKRIYTRILLDDPDKVFSHGSYSGESSLKKSISHFINTHRGAKTHPQQILIGAGIQYLIGILASILRKEIGTVALEHPGYDKAKYIFEDYGFHTIDIPVSEEGLEIDQLILSSARIVYVSPSHQFPTGSLMPINKRLQLLAWAQNNRAYILEDDYDSLIRFESKPVPCLQGLDQNDRVIYLGSFSKLISPALRISYLVLPNRLLPQYFQIAHRYTQTASKIEQLTLSTFIDEGHFDKHLRKIKRIYHKKKDLLKKYLEILWGHHIELISADSGLHAVVRLKCYHDASYIYKHFNQHGLSIAIIKDNHPWYDLSLSYSGVPFEWLLNNS